MSIWQVVYWIGFACAMSGALVLIFKRSLGLARRLFWLGAIGTAMYIPEVWGDWFEFGFMIFLSLAYAAASLLCWYWMEEAE
jgi:hypothetical protein